MLLISSTDRHPNIRCCIRPQSQQRTKVNTDVTVSIDDIKDNRSAVSDISVSAQQYTFTENGDYTFTLTDEAGNKTEIPVTIDYIDKSPTELTVKFKSGDTVLNDSVFTLTADEADYKNAKYTYIYNDTKYLKNDIEAIVMYKGIQVGILKITSDSGEYTFSYTASNGSVRNGFDKRRHYWIKATAPRLLRNTYITRRRQVQRIR